METDATPRPARSRSITVTVTRFGSVPRAAAGSLDRRVPHTLPEGARLADLLAALGIHGGVDLTAAVDGELAGADTPLRDGAQVMLLGPMEGG